VGWESTVLEAASSAGLVGLAVFAFTEAALQPIPPDVLILPMAAAASGTGAYLAIWVVATVSSVLGALAGATLGRIWGRPLMTRFKQERNLARLEVLLERYGRAGVFIAAFSPIPYKVLGWAAGMGKMERRPFLLAGLAGRGLRFGLEVLLVGLYGDEALHAITAILDRELLLAAAMVLCLALAWWAWTWWQGLADDGRAAE
jgi:membrane protein YqaA with SNARE-associated domain